MTTMRERVARAMWTHRQKWALSNGFLLEDWGDGTIPLANGVMDEAADALKAMFEPTGEMLEAGCASHPPDAYHSDTKLADIILAEWRAMMDVASK